jgi:hypothetical protein
MGAIIFIGGVFRFALVRCCREPEFARVPVWDRDAAIPLSSIQFSKNLGARHPRAFADGRVRFLMRAWHGREQVLG